MGKSGVLSHRHLYDVPPGIGGGLLNGGDDFLGLADSDSDLALPVADNDDSPEAQLLPSLNNLRHPPHLNHPLFEPVADLLLLPAGPEPRVLLHQGVRFKDVVPEHGDAAECGAVKLLVGGGDLILRLEGGIVEGGRGDEALRGLRGIEVNVILRVEVVEEGGVDVVGGFAFGAEEGGVVLGFGEEEGDGVRWRGEEREAGRGGEGEGTESRGKRRCGHGNRESLS